MSLILVFSQHMHSKKGRVSLQLIDLMEGLSNIIIALAMYVKILETFKSKNFYYC